MYKIKCIYTEKKLLIVRAPSYTNIFEQVDIKKIKYPYKISILLCLCQNYAIPQQQYHFFR